MRRILCLLITICLGGARQGLKALCPSLVPPLIDLGIFVQTYPASLNLFNRGRPLHGQARAGVCPLIKSTLCQSRRDPRLACSSGVLGEQKLTIPEFCDENGAKLVVFDAKVEQRRVWPFGPLQCLPRLLLLSSWGQPKPTILKFMAKNLPVSDARWGKDECGYLKIP